MKFIKCLIIILVIVSCSDPKEEVVPLSDEYRDITYMISTKEFEDISSFVLDNDEWIPVYNSRPPVPSYSFDNFNVYLLSYDSQLEEGDNPEVQDFEKIAIHCYCSGVNYFYLKYLRANEPDIDSWQEEYPGILAERVYLLKSNHNSGYEISTLVDSVEYFIDYIISNIE